MTTQQEKKLKDRIEKTKYQLSLLQQKRKLEIGELAYQYGIATLANEILTEAFQQLASHHVNHS